MRDDARSDAWLEPALARALDRLEASSAALTEFPHVTEDGAWVTYPDGAWTGGFWVGQLWLLYRVRRDEAARERAEAFLERLLPRRLEERNHDLGMMFYPSAVMGWRATGDERYRQAGIDAARALVAQAHPGGGFIPGWGFFGGDDWSGASLVDTLMNLPLVVWAGMQAQDEALVRAALRHADLSVANHLRSDGSAYHVYRFDPDTGAPLGGGTYQGMAPESRWSRGLGWAIAGLTMLGESLGDARGGSLGSSLREPVGASLGQGLCDSLQRPDYVRAAGRAAAFYRANVPDDLVPYWDFDAEPGAPRDSSAAAISAFGMLRLAALTRDDDLRRFAMAVLESLSRAYADAAPPHALIGHATADLPHGLGLDGATAYGDHYYLKALVEAARGRTPAAPEP